MLHNALKLFQLGFSAAIGQRDRPHAVDQSILAIHATFRAKMPGFSERIPASGLSSFLSLRSYRLLCPAFWM